jgi:hypothetical protein
VDKELDSVNRGPRQFDMFKETNQERMIKGVKGFHEVDRDEVVVLLVLTGLVKLLVDKLDVVQNVSSIEETFLAGGDDSFDGGVDAFADNGPKKPNIGVANVDGSRVGD